MGRGEQKKIKNKKSTSTSVMVIIIIIIIVSPSQKIFLGQKSQQFQHGRRAPPTLCRCGGSHPMTILRSRCRVTADPRSGPFPSSAGHTGSPSSLSGSSGSSLGPEWTPSLVIFRPKTRFLPIRAMEGLWKPGRSFECFFGVSSVSTSQDCFTFVAHLSQ